MDIRAAANIFDRLILSSVSGSNVWTSIKGLLNNAIYGGRMDNVFDVRVLDTFLDQIFNDNVLRNRQLGSFTLPGTTNVKVGSFLKKNSVDNCFNFIHLGLLYLYPYPRTT